MKAVGQTGSPELWGFQLGIPKCPTQTCRFYFYKSTFISINIFYLTACGSGLHILNIYTYRMGTSICTLTLSSANIRGRPKLKFLLD